MTAQQDATAPMPPQTGGDHRRQIATYANYSDAERAVDYLSDNGFPVQRVAIVGTDVQLVEQVVGRLNYGGAALRGAGSGAFTGLLIGWLFGLFNWFTPVLEAFSLVLYGLVFGAAFGALFGLLVHASQRGRRDFASIRVMQPSRYELHVDAEVADRAKDMLARLDGGS